MAMCFLVDRQRRLRRDIGSKHGFHRIDNGDVHRRLIDRAEPDLDYAACIEQCKLARARLPRAAKFDHPIVAEQIGTDLEIAARTVKLFIPVFGLFE
jgi:hypothetical protein